MYTWTTCSAPENEGISFFLKKQVMMKFELETLLMCADDDMEKQATYLGKTLEWCADGLGVRPDQRCVRQLLRDVRMEDCRSISTPLSTTADKKGD